MAVIEVGLLEGPNKGFELVLLMQLPPTTLLPHKSTLQSCQPPILLYITNATVRIALGRINIQGFLTQCISPSCFYSGARDVNRSGP